MLLLHSGEEKARLRIAWPKGSWRLLLDSSAVEWAGPGKGHPGRVRSDGSVRMEVGPATALLYESGGSR